MAGNLVKSVMLKIVASDGDAEAKLDRIAAKGEELKRLHPDLAVKVDTGVASAKLAVLRRELKDTGSQAQATESRFGALGQALNLGLAGGLSTSVGEMGMFQKVLLGMNVATGLGEPLVAGLTVAVGGLASGLVAAGAGVGVFGLVAKAVYTKVSGALTNLTAAQQAYAKATTSAGRATALKQEQAAMAGLTGSQKRFATALTASKNEWSKFVNAASPGVTSVMAAGLALLPKALAMMKPFLAPTEKALHGILADVGHAMTMRGPKGLTDLARGMGLVKDQSQGALTPFGKFVTTMSKASGPMITGLAHAIGHVVVGIGGILEAFMPVSHGIVNGLDSITAKFARWGQTLGSHSGFQSLMSMFKSETPLAVNALKQLGGIIKTVVGQMTGISTFSNSKMLLQLAVPVLAFANALLKAHPQLVWLVLYLKLAADGGKKLKVAFEGISGAFSGVKSGVKAFGDLKAGIGDAEAAASDATGAWGTFGGKLSNVGSMFKTVALKMGILRTATEEGTVAQEGLDVAMEANPIGIIIVAVVALGAALALLIIKVKPVRDFFKGLWRDLKNWFSDGINFIKSHWKLLPAIFLGPLGIVVSIVLTHFRQIKQYAMNLVNGVRSVLAWFGRLPGLFRGWWDQAVSAVEGAAARLIGFVRTIPGRILSALGNLGHLLWSAGQAVLQGLIGGIESMIGSVIHAAASVGSSILSSIKGALGIGSPSKYTFVHGQMLGLGLINGMDSMRGHLQAAAQRMYSPALPGGSGGPLAARGGGASGGGRDQRIVLEFSTADSQIMTAFANAIRVRGGDPRILSRKVVLA